MISLACTCHKLQSTHFSCFNLFAKQYYFCLLSVNIPVLSVYAHRGCFSAGARERQQLLTIFALSNKYQPSDVALAVSSQLHSTVFQMSHGSLLTMQPCPYQKTQLENTSQLPAILQVACFRLLQLIAVTTGLV